MSLKNKLFIIFAILFSNLIFVYSFDVCNVEVSEPWLVASDELGLEVLIVDSQGDMYFEGVGHSADDKNLIPSFSVGDNIHFNRDTSKFVDYNDNLSVIPSDRGLEIQNSAGDTVGLFAEDGNVYTKGQGIYEGSQAGCLNDGWLYCNSDGVTRENRDYYCKITGSKTGFCDFNIVNSEDCSTKLSIDTDGGSNRWTAGTVTDYIDCSSGSCTFNTYSDVCTSSTVLLEYRNQGSSYSSTSIDCTNDNYYFCSGLNRMEKRYDCSSGECTFDSNRFVQTCTAPSDSITGWSCDNSTRKVRTVTAYSPTCNSGSCGVSSSSINEYENCPSGETCEGGVCGEVCVPDCSGKECGSDGCEGSCGSCSSGYSCSGGSCVSSCTPDCSGKECGFDGCGGICGSCMNINEICSYGNCIIIDYVITGICEPNCFGKDCGDDGCGGSCGTCPTGEFCSGGNCVNSCFTSCSIQDKACGTHTICGVSMNCGSCRSGYSCSGGSCVRSG